MISPVIGGGLIGLLLFSTMARAAPFASNSTGCKYIPGDKGWPSQQDWQALNKTVGGKLVASQLISSICHYEAVDNVPLGPYDEAECAALRESYDLMQTHMDWPAEILNPYFQNQTCSPWTPPEQPCELGNHVSYAISLSAEGNAAQDVAAGIRFAKEHNIRLVVKNTGHDYSGRSTGKGALSIWTHNLKGHRVTPKYTSNHYTGPAVTLAAGTQGFDAMEYMRAAGYRVVGGECPTVGIAGGYTTGGGHSLLNSKYGMAADSVLEWEVVTPEGELVVATPDGKHADLYWALSGGGGGTWGVTLSMTTKIYPEGGVAGATFGFSAEGVSADAYWAASARFYAFMVEFTDKGNTMTWAQTNTSFTALTVTMPDQDASAAAAQFADLLQSFEDLGVSYTFVPRHWDSYYDHYAELEGPLPYGNQMADTAIFTSVIVPRAVVSDPSNWNAVQLTEALRHVTSARDARFTFGCTGISVGAFSHVDNAVHSAWRNAVAMCVVVAAWDRSVPHEEMVELKKFTMTDLIPTLETATPGGAVYLNEIDPLYQGDWKTTGYGRDKYDRLLSIKKKYDPSHVFWSPFSVGGDLYTTDTAGRVCKA